MASQPTAPAYNASNPAVYQPISYSNDPTDPNYNPWLSGMPGSPTFNPVYNSSMAMLPGYEKYLKDNSQGYDAYRAMALRTAPSNWANLAKTQQAMEAQDQSNKAVKESSASTHQAEDQLGMQGGLTSGARERVAEQGATNLTGAQQGIERQHGLNDLQISINDEQNRMSQLGQLPVMESQRNGAWEGVRQGDLANQIAENKSLNDFNQNSYGQTMQAWAAGKQAEATSRSGKGGGK